jgi:hypothetical protein
MVSKLSEIYDPGCSSRIRILIFCPSRILDLGVKKAPDPGSATLVVTVTLSQFTILKAAKLPNSREKSTD